MSRALVKKCLRESRWLFCGCFLAIFGFCWLRVWMVSRLDTSRFKAIIDLLPGDWKKFSSVDMDWLITYSGRISLAFDEPIVVFCVSIWAIARGSDAISGELNRGTMEMLLAQPVSRLRVLWTQSLLTVVGVCLLGSSAWLGTYLGIQTNYAKEEVQPVWNLPIPLPFVGKEIPRPWAKTETRYTHMTQKVDAAVFWPAAVNLCCLGIFWAGFATLISACDRYRWRTIGITVAIYVVQMALKLIGMGSTDWHWLLDFSIFAAYEPEAIAYVATTSPSHTWNLMLDQPIGKMSYFGPLSYHLLMAVLGSVAYAASAIVFHRRDLPAPL